MKIHLNSHGAAPQVCEELVKAVIASLLTVVFCKTKLCRSKLSIGFLMVPVCLLQKCDIVISPHIRL